MPLYKFKDFYPNYREAFSDSEILNLDSYSLSTEGNDSIGSVKDALVDSKGAFRYLVIDTGSWIFGKKILLPIGLARFDYNNERVYVDGLTKDQVNHLPEYHDDMVVDEPYEKRIRDVYGPLASRRTNRQYFGSNYSTQGQQSSQAGTTQAQNYTDRSMQDRGGARSDMADSDYEREPTFYGMSDQDSHRQLKLYEERLVTSKERHKTGEVAVGKRVTTDTSQVSVPIDNERIIIERTNAGDERVATSDRPTFEEGEVARMEVYEETAEIEKQPFVREVVNIRKQVDHDTVDAEETVRREELDVQKSGQPNINQDSPRSRPRR